MKMNKSSLKGELSFILYKEKKERKKTVQTEVMALTF